MADDELRKILARAIRAHSLTDIELSALSGLSVPVARAARHGQMPKVARCRRALAAFAERAAATGSRQELGLP